MTSYNKVAMALLALAASATATTPDSPQGTDGHQDLQRPLRKLMGKELTWESSSCTRPTFTGKTADGMTDFECRAKQTVAACCWNESNQCSKLVGVAPVSCKNGATGACCPL